MQFSRRQLVKFAAKAANPMTPSAASDNTTYDIGGGQRVGGAEFRIAGLRNPGYRDRLVLVNMGQEGQRIADKYNVDISPETIAKLQAAAPKMKVGPGGMLYSAPAQPKAPSAPAKETQIAGAGSGLKLNIQMSPAAKRAVKAQEAAYAKQQAAKAQAAAPAAAAPAAAAPAASPAKETQVAEGMPVVF